MHIYLSGPMINDEGETVISQEEYESITKLHELKANYRNNFHDLRQTKSEIFYCQKLVDQTRQRLIQGIIIINYDAY